jgi:hypothetical protein
MAHPRAKLDDTIRAFIVTQLAAYEYPGDVMAMVRKEYGIEVTRQTIEGYDPTKVAGERLSEKWRVRFFKAREAFKNDTTDIPTCNKAVRLRYLDEEVRKARRKGNTPLVASLLEQIAKESGDAYGAKRAVALTNPDGSPLTVKHEGELAVTLPGMTDLVRSTLDELAEEPTDGSGAS